jgi:hypothetical protein
MTKKLTPSMLKDKDVHILILQPMGRALYAVVQGKKYEISDKARLVEFCLQNKINVAQVGDNIPMPNQVVAAIKATIAYLVTWRGYRDDSDEFVDRERRERAAHLVHEAVSGLWAWDQWTTDRADLWVGYALSIKSARSNRGWPDWEAIKPLRDEIVKWIDG